MKTKDHWDLRLKGVSVWSYFRFIFHEAKITNYKPKIAFSWADVAGILQLLTLRFRKIPIVVFISDRKELLLVYDKLTENERSLLFIRGEISTGNTLIVEGLRHVFRRLGYLCYFRRYRSLLKELTVIFEDQSNASSQQLRRMAAECTGEYLFNKVLSWFLKNKKVYYSNCVVPRIERHMGLMNSYEIQHGIIYKGHLDYTNVPSNVIKNRLLVWDDFWADRIANEVGYGGPIDAVGISLKEDQTASYEMIVYTTVNQEFSNKVKELDSIRLSEGGRIAVQPHPRDYFQYEFSNDGVEFVARTSPSAGKTVVVHDSTIILACIQSDVFFYYLALESECLSELSARLETKYGVRLDEHYKVVKRLSEVELVDGN